MLRTRILGPRLLQPPTQPSTTVGTSSDQGPEIDIADAVIKAKALSFIIKLTGVSTQLRQSRLGIQALGNDRVGLSEREIVVRCDTAIRADALLGNAWFNRALALQRLGEEKEAFESFLVAAAVMTNDDEAWLHVLFLARKFSQDLMISLLQYLPHQRGAAFVRFLAESAQRSANENTRAALLELARLFAEHLPPPEAAVIRIHGNKGRTTTGLNGH